MITGTEFSTIGTTPLREFFSGFFVAFWTVGIAFTATFLLSSIMEPGISPLLLLAVMYSAWRGGLFAGLLATLLSAIGSLLIFIPPVFSLDIDKNDLYELIVFSFAAIVIGSLSAARRRAEDGQKRLLIEAQAARVEAENANSVKDEFLAVVSHELRTPLTTIKTLTRVMQRRDISLEERSEYLKDIASECDRQIDLVHNLLDLSRIKSGGLEFESQFIDVGEVIRACEKIERIEVNEHGHKLVIELADDLHFIRADRNALRRALCTIIENAIKFTPSGGRIILRAYNSEQQIIIEIEDTGHGIGARDLPHIFDKFYRGRLVTTENDEDPSESFVPGVGLGLNLARALISGMKGTIEVKSRVGEGTTFSVQLPIWRERGDSGINSERAFPASEKTVPEIIQGGN